jgi:hypothetical protein
MWSFWVNVIMLLILGVLGASSVIVKKRPEAKDLIDKLSKISGYVGVLAVLWGVYDVIQLITHLGMFKYGMWGIISWVTLLAVTAVFLGLGFIFGYGLAAAYMSEEAKAKMAGLRQKLVGYQIPLGWLSLALAVWLIVLTYVIMR